VTLQTPSRVSNHHHNHHPWKTYHYYLENDKNGSLQRHSINLDETVIGVLTSIANALQSSGVPNVTLPPPWPTIHNMSSYDDDSRPRNSNKQQPSTASNHGSDTSNTTSSSSSINHSFDINTNKSRNLLFFLQQYADPLDIQQRRQNRLDAQTAALVTRQLFHFSLIDGTRVGWSSSSLAKSLSSLATLYDDHSHKFKVQSFYPFRLVMNNSDSYEQKVDVFGGGTITLHPAATPSQWLETLLTVSPKDIEQVLYYQEQQQLYVSTIQNRLQLQIRRGYTCSSELYYTFLETLYHGLMMGSGGLDSDSLTTTLQAVSCTIVSTSLHTQLIVEAEDLSGSLLCTNQSVDHSDVLPVRARISESGCIHMSLQMNSSIMTRKQENHTPSIVVASILACLETYRHDAQLKRKEYLMKESKWKDDIQWLKVHFGLTRVFKVTPSLVTIDQLLQCTHRLLQLEESKRIVYQSHLAGHSLGIVGSGHSCHLGDDGSIIVPWDWL